MKFTEYISTHQAFTTTSLLEAADSWNAATRQLKLAAASGAVERVRQGLYVSKTGRFDGATADPYAIVAALDHAAVISYHTALEAHGVAHNVGFECHFRTAEAKTPFSYAETRFVPHPSDNTVQVQTIRGRAFGSVRCTTKEQTVFDCLKHPEWAGGIEETIRSASAMSYIDAEALSKMASADSASMAARVGWLLGEMSAASRWHVPEETIAQLQVRSHGVTSKMDKRAARTRGWSSEWQMALPATAEEVRSWLQ